MTTCFSPWPTKIANNKDCNFVICCTCHLQGIPVAHPVDHKDNGDQPHDHHYGQDHLTRHCVDLVQHTQLVRAVNILAAATGGALLSNCGTG